MMLEVENLDLFYGDAQALDGVSLEVPEGEIVAIVGANGAGKSTLIRTIAGIERPRAGRIRFRGQDITGLPSHRICNLGIGQVAEGRQVFPSLTVEENLEMGALLPRARAAMRETMAEVYAMFPRLAERRDQPAGTMSGGEQQMLAIGRCLMGKPELIMFDEPSLGLAPALVQELFRTIRALNERGMTVLLVEQNVVASLKLATRAYVLENGRIVMSGTGLRCSTTTACARPISASAEARARVIYRAGKRLSRRSRCAPILGANGDFNLHLLIEAAENGREREAIELCSADAGEVGSSDPGCVFSSCGQSSCAPRAP